MPSGRPRVSAAVKKAHGTDRKDRPEPTMKRDPGEKCPQRPSKLKAQGKWFWDKWAKNLWNDNWLSAKSAMGFTALCEAYYRSEKHRMHLDRVGDTYETMTREGLTIKPHPRYAMMHKELEYMKSYYHEFGFTPLGERRNSPANLKDKKSKPTAKEKKDIKQFVRGPV